MEVGAVEAVGVVAAPELGRFTRPTVSILASIVINIAPTTEATSDHSIPNLSLMANSTRSGRPFVLSSINSFKPSTSDGRSCVGTILVLVLSTVWINTQVVTGIFARDPLETPAAFGSLVEAFVKILSNTVSAVVLLVASIPTPAIKVSLETT